MEHDTRVNLAKLKLHLGKNTFEGHDSVLGSVRITALGKSFIYDPDEDLFYSINREKGTTDTIKYADEKLIIDDESGERLIESSDLFRPVHLDKNTGKIMDLSNDYTKIAFETDEGDIFEFKIQELYSQNAKNNYPVDEAVLDHTILKLHSKASTDVNHEISGEDLEELISSDIYDLIIESSLD